MGLSSVSYAVIGSLKDQRLPVVSSYDLFRILWDVYTYPERYPIKIRKRVTAPGRDQYSRIISELGSERLLRPDPDFEEEAYVHVKTRVFRVSEVPDRPAEEIACIIDPFASISYLSAMQWYGLTVRQPRVLTLTTLRGSLWLTRAGEKVIDDYGFDPDEAEINFFKPLHVPSMPSRLRERPVEIHRTIHPFRSQDISDGFARIITIGDLFAQMLDSPNLCGGMSHVLDVWEEHAETYLDPIIQSVDTSSPIVKVRAGYILTDRVGISDPRIEDWKRFAQRGGSRKLDPSQPYAPVFSEDWMLSLNV